MLMMLMFTMQMLGGAGQWLAGVMIHKNGGLDDDQVR